MKHKTEASLPSSYSVITADTILAGPPILPIDRISLYNSTEWEKFVEEWVASLQEKYAFVERLGGSGDMGRDVVAHVEVGGVWDNYQCKHYDTALSPSNIWSELGKIAHYTFIREYTIPRKYYFVAPRGVGTSLANKLKKPDELRAGLIDNWDNYCKRKITDKHEVLLSDPLRQHIQEIDFAIFDYITPLSLIEQHSKTRYHVPRFGGGLPARRAHEPPPEHPTSDEITYIKKLLAAYSDHAKMDISGFDDIHKDYLHEHYRDSRIEFYSAEALRLFSRDNLPAGEYERLQAEIHDGIRDEIRSVHSDGYQRVLAVVKTAKLLPIDNHPLISRIQIRGKGGICHQLANEKDSVKWVPSND